METIMPEGKMLLKWSYWPKWNGCTIGDPITEESVVDSLRHAVKVSNDIKARHGDDLLYVDVRIRLIDS